MKEAVIKFYKFPLAGIAVQVLWQIFWYFNSASNKSLSENLSAHLFQVVTAPFTGLPWEDFHFPWWRICLYQIVLNALWYATIGILFLITRKALLFALSKKGR